MATVFIGWANRSLVKIITYYKLSYVATVLTGLNQYAVCLLQCIVIFCVYDVILRQLDDGEILSNNQWKKQGYSLRLPFIYIGCENVFGNKYKLKEHVRVHTQEKLIACPDCGGMFANQTKLLDHLSRQNPEACKLSSSLRLDILGT